MRRLFWSVLGMVVLVAGFAVREALRGYGIAAEAVDERGREDDLDNAAWAGLSQPMDHPPLDRICA